eukprot:TRINITY_DN49436_c0_g1_i1.p1 TRINITY_DN49436_c0_g1~~TRINITY_DN49436_c0_g1_i1.p1  ORF type:complete len:440 (+),score=58.91 TRINITY_DN49436_c0_g1_i1:82-1401(+)
MELEAAIDATPLGPYHALVWFAGFGLSGSSQLANALVPFILPDIQAEFGLDKAAAAAALSSATLFAPLGSVIVGIAGDRYGRRAVVLLCLCLLATSLVASLILPSGALGLTALTVLRAVAGAASAGLCVFPAYLSEVTSRRARGWFLSTATCGYYVGSTVATYVGKVLPHDWRQAMAAIAVVPLIAALPVLYCTESPRWLYLKGKTSEGRAALSKFGCPLLDDVHVLEQSSPQSLRTRLAVACDAGLRMRALVACSLMVVIEMTVTVWGYWGPETIMELNHQSMPYYLLFLSQALCASLSLAWGPSMNLVGRRWLIVASLLAISAASCLIVMGLYPAGMYVVIQICISSGYAATRVWIMEAFPTTLRSSAAGISMAFGQLGASFAPAAFASVSLDRGLFSLAALAALGVATAVFAKDARPDDNGSRCTHSAAVTMVCNA